jgi:murein DD-endopeptidase MepM/ murein hydrolase activator NlpD
MGQLFSELKPQNNKIKIKLIIFLCLLLFLPSAWIIFMRMEGGKPSVLLETPSKYIGFATEFTGNVSDPGSGVRKLWIGLLKDGKEVVLKDEEFPSQSFISGGSVHDIPIQIKIEPGKLGINEGKAMIRIAVWDYSWRNWWKGNSAYLEHEVIIDTKPPVIDVLTKAHNISQGGAGLVIYRVSEKDAKTGVAVGENFFPGYSGYFKDERIFLAFIALDHLQGTDTEIHVEAMDKAGNSARAGLLYYLRKKVFKKDTIPISDAFLNWKMPEFDIPDARGGQLTGIEKFLAVNNGMRKENEALFLSLAGKTEKKLFWKGDFLRLPKSATRAGFAERRTYQYKGKIVDHQFHMGIDLASTAHSSVPAANAGRVVFADVNGIYGKTVVLDHGFGLFSLYSHLSRIMVQPGEMVEKGAILGLTGTTGLAGGDHLHYGMMVQHVLVSPVEWWDSSWIQNNIISKLEDIHNHQ